MKITKEQVEHVASLAKLSLSEEEIERLRTQMGGMIAFADEINTLNVASVRPTTHAIAQKNVFREDGCAPSYDRAVMLENAPMQDGECVVVPRVVE